MILLDKKTYNIMIAFVSSLPKIPETVEYSGADDGTAFCGIQTNEAGIYQLQHSLREAGGLDRIILVTSKDVTKLHSAEPWKNIFEKYGRSSMSAIDFLKEQVKAKHPELAERFEESAFDEDAGTEGAMRYIAALGDVIQREQEAAEAAGLHDIVLHADMTGGFRHTSMMMLAIMQLSKYMGIRIGHVLYAGKDRNAPKGSIVFADDIHRMFDMIAGMDEFQKYGSVQALDEYFGDTRAYSEPFRSLLGAMRSFSDAIRICRTSIIEKELESLGEHMRVFRNQSGGPIQEELFRRIIRVLEREYGTVLGSGTSEERHLNIIAWCLRKKFLQQAMTLCTEWIPQIIVDKRICYTENILAMRKCKKNAKNGFRSWQQEFIISYSDKRPKKTENKIPYGDAGEMFCFILKHNREALIAELPEDLQKPLRSFLDAHREKLNVYTNKDILLHPINTENASLRRAIEYFKKGQKTPLSYQLIPERVGGLSEGCVIEIFGLSAADIDRPTKTPAPQLTVEELREQKWAKREADYRRMLAGAKRIMRSDLPLDAALDYLRGYFDIREERNQSNHAVVTADQESSKLEKTITAYIEKLRAYQRAVTP
ncbi:TM1812 family CRISPR-associated protein [Selenomonas sp. oral taxon 138]|uniref:TM1812 family CRISPR-associated protein n=1 Tax=Selenomonas sp. oral taxon 138 TaxID=712532 RepID=UPI0002A3ACA0|nr:TM1812 family CRISPR-associated protein [Selenomonas sp. oral taxon 138]EKX95803.1 CRISPR-associated protein [Selenomonas sp. oral taxon 138 str. F0429]